MSKSEKIRLGIFEVLFYLFILSFFLVLGSDFESQRNPRLVFGAVLFIFAIIFCLRPLGIKDLFQPTIFIFTIFVLFELFRAGYFWINMRDAPEFKVYLDKYLTGALRWPYQFGVFVLSYHFFKTRARIFRLQHLFVWTCFVFAINAIPSILLNGEQYYVRAEGGKGFFYPIIYFSDWVPKYLIGTYAHSNYVGDLMLFGFFSAITLSLYSYHIYHRNKKHMELIPSDRPYTQTFSFMGIRLTAAFAIMTACVVLFSRGTILSLGIALIFFAVFFVIKYYREIPWGWAIVGIGLGIGLVLWSMDVNKALKDVRGLKKESFGVEGVDSSSSNARGFKIARAMYREHSLWGVGTRGYGKHARKIAKQIGIEFPPNIKAAAKYEALCFYTQMLAEEGIGAYIYFLFLVIYFSQLSGRLLRTQSYYKFLAALSFSCPVIMVYFHGGFGYLMQRFSLNMLIFVCMGASLAALRKDFEHV